MPEIIADNISIVETKELEGATRLEAEYYNKPSFIVNNFLKGGKIIDYVQYGTSEDLNEKLKGYPVLRLNEFDGSFIGSPSKYCNKITSEVFNKLVLKERDILVCRTNGNPKLVGKSAVVMEDANMAFASYLFRVRPKASLINSTTLSVYLNSCIGRREIERNLMVSNQANFSPDKFRDIKVPLFSSEFQAIIDNIVHRAYLNHKCSKLLYSQAEALLLEELNIKNVDLSHEPCYEVNSADTIIANRIDAEYYQPKYERVIEAIENSKYGWCKLPDRITNIIDKYDPYKEQERNFRYIELSNINPSIGVIDDYLELKGKDLPSRARMLIREGDVIISSVEGSIDKVALVDNIHDGCIASTGFFVFRANENTLPEYALVLCKSILIQKQLEKLSSGTILAAVPKNLVETFIIPDVPKEAQKEIAILIRQPHSARRQAKELLEQAKQKVEEMIEKGTLNGMKKMF